MESLDNLKPFDDLEVLSDDVDLFMEAMCHPPHMADVLWQQAKLKKQKENSDLYANNHGKPEKINPRLDRTGDPISGLSRAATTKKTPPQESNQSIFDKRWIEEPERLTLVQSYNHWMNENALRMEMGIPLVPHPKLTFSKIHGLSESESSSNWEDELMSHSNSVKAPKSKPTQTRIFKTIKTLLQLWLYIGTL